MPRARRRLDRQAVLELPEQGFYPARSQLGGGQLQWSLVIELRVSCGKEAPGCFGRFPDLLRQRDQPGDPFQPLALLRAQNSLPLTPLQSRPRRDDALEPTA